MSETSKKYERRPNRIFPRHVLEETLVVADAIQNKNAGKPMKRILLADAINRKPTSPEFRDLLSSSYRYGLTLGTEKAEYIALSDLGKKITKPTSPEQLIETKQKALLSSELFNKVYSHYKDSPFPRSGQFFENVLETEFGVPREYVKEVIVLLEKNGHFSGIIRDVSGAPYVTFDNVITTFPEDLPESETGMGIEIDTNQMPETAIAEKTMSRPIFIAHGKNKKPLEQLKNILDQFKIPYKVAVEEPHSGRPISEKIRDLMNECGSAIFIFTSDAAQESDVSVINPNVAFELGAASYLYGDKLIIFKEEQIELPTDFNSIGYIFVIVQRLAHTHKYKICYSMF